MKKCSRCKLEKPLTEFCIDKRKPNGRAYECLVCKKIRSKKYRATGAEKEYWKRPEVIANKKAWNKRDYVENKEAYVSRTKNWVEQNYERHRRYQTAYTASYRAYKKQATPTWCSELEIFEFYKNCPKDMEVDHIIPLNHSEVCGLHLPCNFQYLSRTDNASKNNSWDGTYENESWRLKVL